jgi:N-acetylglucosamine repressor
VASSPRSKKDASESASNRNKMSQPDRTIFSQYSEIQKTRMNLIVKTILNNKKVTRTQLSGVLKLSPSAIVKYVKTLQQKGLINETDRQMSSSGRQSTFLEINPDVGLNIAVIFSVSKLNGALIDIGGNILHEQSVGSHMGIMKDDLLRSFFELLDALEQQAIELQREVFGIGIALGGHIDPKNGISHEYLYAKEWYDVPLKQIVEHRYSIPCFLVNDANACALGEKYYGMGLGVRHFLCILLGEGLGMGIVVNDEIYMGKNYYAGEFGHMKAVDNGQLCFCGHSGCLETITAQGYILASCKEGLRHGVNSIILKYCGKDFDTLEIEHVILAANEGDRLAQNIFGQVALHLGGKLADIANIFNPELIILRGPVIDGNRFLFESIRRMILHQSLRPIAKELKVVYSQERTDVYFKGINSLILVDYLSEES